MEEIWKETYFNGLKYYISNYGNVETDNKEIKLRENKDGYFVFTAGKKKHRSVIKVHRAVAMLFVDGYQENFEVNHIDFNRQNNRADNLEWISHRDNIYHSIKNGRYDKLYVSQKYNNANAKLSIEQVKEIKQKLKDGVTVMKIAKEYGRGWTTIDHIKKGETWKDVE